MGHFYVIGAVFTFSGCDIRLVIPVISVHSGVDFRCVFESKYLIFSIDLENFT